MNIVNGTHYADDTLQDVIDVLERARAAQWRIRIHYGNTFTGQDWNEDYDVTGRVGRSMGPVKVPILLYRKGSMCGSPMLDHCIVRIRRANKQHGKDDLYCHPRYHGEAA
jgi:hypothetical protein